MNRSLYFSSDTIYLGLNRCKWNPRISHPLTEYLLNTKIVDTENSDEKTRMEVLTLKYKRSVVSLTTNVIGVSLFNSIVSAKLFLPIIKILSTIVQGTKRVWNAFESFSEEFTQRNGSRGIEIFAADATIDVDKGDNSVLEQRQVLFNPFFGTNVAKLRGCE